MRASLKNYMFLLSMPLRVIARQGLVDAVIDYRATSNQINILLIRIKPLSLIFPSRIEFGTGSGKTIRRKAIVIIIFNVRVTVVLLGFTINCSGFFYPHAALPLGEGGLGGID